MFFVAHYASIATLRGSLFLSRFKTIRSNGAEWQLGQKRPGAFLLPWFATFLFGLLSDDYNLLTYNRGKKKHAIPFDSTAGESYDGDRS